MGKRDTYGRSLISLMDSTLKYIGRVRQRISSFKDLRFVFLPQSRSFQLIHSPLGFSPSAFSEETSTLRQLALTNSINININGLIRKKLVKNSRPSPGNRNMFHAHKWDSSDFFKVPWSIYRKRDRNFSKSQGLEKSSEFTQVPGIWRKYEEIWKNMKKIWSNYCL